MEVPVRQLFIAGRWVAPAQGARYPVVCPATEEVIGSIPAATPEDVEAAVEAALAAVKSKQWTGSSGAYRAAFLRKIADKVCSCVLLPPCCSSCQPITMLGWWLP